jgi:hypothetical protein
LSLRQAPSGHIDSILRGFGGERTELREHIIGTR